MHTAAAGERHSAQSAPPQVLPWLRGLARRLDGFGPAAWAGVALLGLIVFAPIGLLIIGYIIWSGRMGKISRSLGFSKTNDAQGVWVAPTGSPAFDAYRAETIARLEEERQAFESFLERLRAAKDKAEFEQFMAERRTGGGAPTPDQSGSNFAQT